MEHPTPTRGTNERADPSCLVRAQRGGGMSKAARAKAESAAKMARQRAAERRRRALIAGITAAPVLAVASVLGVVLYRAQQPDTVAIPHNATAAGVTLGTAGPTVDVYFDFQCP